MKAPSTIHLPRRTALAASFAFLAVSGLPAATYMWDLGVNGTWGDPAFWDPSTGFPNAPDDVATISVPGDSSGAYFVTLDGNYMVEDLTLSSADVNLLAAGRIFTVEGTLQQDAGLLDLNNSTLSGGGIYTMTGGELSLTNGTVSIPVDNSAGLIEVMTAGTFNNGLGNDGSLTVANSTTLTLNNANLSNGGTLSLLAGANTSTITSSTGQTLVNEGGGILTVAAGATGQRRFTINLDNQGDFNINSSTLLNRSGGIHSNSGTITAPALLTVQNAGELTNSNALTSTGGYLSLAGDNSPSSIFQNTGTLTVANGIGVTGFEQTNNSGLIDITGGNGTFAVGQFNNSQFFTNSGDIEVAPSSMVTLNTGYTQGTANYTFDPGSTLDGGGDLRFTSINLTIDGAYSPNTSALTVASTAVGGAGSLGIAGAGSFTTTASTYGIPITNDGTTEFRGTQTANAGITNNAAFDLANNSTLTLNNADFTNNGTLDLLGGSNVVTISSTAQALRNAPSGTITVDPAGTLRSFTLDVENEGQFDIDATTRFNLAGGVHSNSGTITASQLFSVLNAEEFSNSNLLTSTGGNLNFDGNNSATSLFDNSGTVTVANGMGLLQFETVTNSGLIDVIGGTANITIGQFNNPQTFTNSGDIEVAPGSTFGLYTGYTQGTAGVVFDPGSTLDGGGNLTMSSITLTLNGAYSPNTSPLSVTSSTIMGTGPLLIPASSSLTSTGSTYSVPVTTNGATDFSGSHTLNAAFVNNDTFTLANNSTLTLNNEDFTNNGLLELAGGSNSSTITSAVQSLVNTASGTISVAAGTGLRSFTLDLDNQGQFDIEAPTRFNLSGGEYSNSGTLTVDQTLTVSNAENFSNSSQLTSTGGNFSFDGTNSATSVFDNSGTLTIGAGMGLGQFETVTNSGTIDITSGDATLTIGQFNNPQSFTNSGDIEVPAGSIFTLQTGHNAGVSGITFDSGSTLDGGGNIHLGTVTLTLGGAYSPGTSPLSATNSVIGGASGSLAIPATSGLTSVGTTYGIPITSDASVDFSGSNTLGAGFINNDSFNLANNSTLTISSADFTNNGMLELAGGSNRTTITSGDRALVNGPSSTITVLPGSGERYFQLSLDNRGQFDIDAPIRLNRSGGSYLNSGMMDASATIRIEGSSFSNTGGVTTSGQLVLSNVESFSNSSQLTSTGGNFSFDGNSTGTSSFENSGTMTVANGLGLGQFETMTNSGTLNVNGGDVTVTVGQFSNPQLFTNSGDIEVPAGSTFTLQTGHSLPTTAVTFDSGSTLDGGGDINLTTVALTLGGDYSPMTSPLRVTNSTIGGAAGSLDIPATSSLTSTGSTFGVPVAGNGDSSFTGTNTLNDGFTNESTFSLGNASALTINNEDYTNNGLFEMIAGGSITTITSGAQTLVNAPTATIDVLAGGTERRFNIDLDNQGILNIGSNLRVNRTASAVANSGLITTSALFRTDSAETFTNTGNITSTATGSLSFAGSGTQTSAWDNSGTVTVGNGMGLATFETVTSSGLIDVTGGDVTFTIGQFQNIQTFINSGDIEVPPGSTFSFQTGNNAGVSQIEFAPGSTWDGGGDLVLGTVTLTLAGAYSPGTSPLAVTNSTIGGAGSLDIAGGSSLTSVGSTYNAAVNNDGAVDFSNTHTLNAAFVNNGTHTLANNSTLNFNSADYTNNGLLELAGGANITTIASGAQTLVNAPGGTIEVLAGTAERRLNTDFDNQGIVNVDSSLRVTRSSAVVDNSGEIVASALFRTNSAEMFSNSGTIDANATGSLSFQGTNTATSTWENSGTVTVGNTMGLARFENVTNSGLIDVKGSSLTMSLGQFNNPQQFFNRGEIRISSGAVFTLNNTWNATAVNEAAGVISGEGTFDRTTVAFTNAGTIAPGLSPGVLTFAQDLTNSSTAAYEIEIASTDGAGAGHDQIVVNGNLVLSGTLKPELLGGFNPTPSDSFVIMRTAGGELTGNFDSIEQPYAPFGIFDVTIDEALDQVILTFTGTGPISYEDFQDLYFTPAEIGNGDADRDVDFDHDGLSNLAEWVHGFNPTSGVRPVAAMNVDRDESGRIELTFARSLLLPENSVEITVLTSPDGSAPFVDIPVADYEFLPGIALPGNIELVTIRVTNPIWGADALRLFRLRFTELAEP